MNPVFENIGQLCSRFVVNDHLTAIWQPIEPVEPHAQGKRAMLQHNPVLNAQHLKWRALSLDIKPAANQLATPLNLHLH